MLHTLACGLLAIKRRLPLLLFTIIYLACGGYIVYHMACYLAGVLIGTAGYTPATVWFFAMLSSVFFTAITTPLIILFGRAIETYRERVKQAQRQ